MLLIKDLTPGCALYALIKNDEGLTYLEGSVIGVGQPRVEMPNLQGQNSTVMPNFATRQVIDLTYQMNGKNHTEAVDVSMGAFPSRELGDVAMVASEKDAILREIDATMRQAELDLKAVKTKKKWLEDGKAIKGKLDTAYSEKQQMESRLNMMEEKIQRQSDILEEILKNVKK